MLLYVAEHLSVSFACNVINIIIISTNEKLYYENIKVLIKHWNYIAYLTGFVLFLPSKLLSHIIPECLTVFTITYVSYMILDIFILSEILKYFLYDCIISFTRNILDVLYKCL